MTKPSTCQTCGMLCELGQYEFHPYQFCIWHQGGLNPWDALNSVLLMLGYDRVNPITVERARQRREPA